MIGRMVERAAKAFGVVVVPEWRAIRLSEERHLARLLRFLDVDCVFDVGGNVGQYGDMLRNCVGYTGRVISFEPDPAAFAILKAKASRDPLWYVEPVALSSSAGTATFHSYDRSDLSSFYDFSTSHHAPTRMGSKSIEVSTQTLDTYLPGARKRWNFNRPFLKLDTQGFDLEIAKGAAHSLREFVGLQSEIAFQTIYAGAPDWRSVLAFYESAGFSISRLVPIHEIHFPQLVEMDVIMVRSDLAALA